MASNIGIKIANGEFYPIIEENSSIKKRLILTTVHDNQPSVQIDLYRNPANAMSDAQYIGSLVVENIKPKPRGEPSIEMVISSDENGDIIADAIDLDTGAAGEHYVLTVSLKSLDETSRDMDIPDFELETNEEPPSGLYNQASKVREKKSGSKLWIIILIILLLLGLAAAWLFFLGGMDVVRSIFDKQDNKATEQTVSQTQPVKETETVKQTEPVRQEPVITEPPQKTEPVQRVVEPPVVIAAPVEPPRQQTTRRSASGRNPPVASYDVPATIPREGVNYRIRWGDTLWDIAEAFYRDPWLYPRIARHNNIRNPNLIISGRTLRVPPRD